MELNGFDQYLSLPPVQRHDDGLYSCIVSNMMGTDRRYFSVVVSGEKKRIAELLSMAQTSIL